MVENKQGHMSRMIKRYCEKIEMDCRSTTEAATKEKCGYSKNV